MEKLNNSGDVQTMFGQFHCNVDIHYCKCYNYEIIRADDIHHIYYNGNDKIYIGFYFDDLYFVPAARYRLNLRSNYPSFIRTIRTLLENTKEGIFDTRMEVYYERV